MAKARTTATAPTTFASWVAFLRRISTVQAPLGCWRVTVRSGTGIRTNNEGREQIVFQGETKAHTVARYALVLANLEAAAVVGKVASHLCHNAWCCNPEHVVYETQRVNVSRNGCYGPGHCCHVPRCLASGPGAGLVDATAVTFEQLASRNP